MRLDLGAVTMQPRFSVQIVAISLCLTVLACSHVAVDCADWNSKEYFEAATAADVAVCIQSGADLKARTEFDLTPLHRAASFNANPAVIAALVDAGADLKARTEFGWTPLHLAANFNANPAVIAALVDAGADLKVRTEFGWTPLHLAARSNENSAVIAALLDAGADPKTRTKDGKMPWDYAKDREPLKRSDAYWRLNDARF